MDIEYIIVQAGGKGTRLEYLTKNKPKAIVPIDNLPMIFHLFNKFPNKKFIIIGDYKHDVLEKYLSSFATVEYEVVVADGTGTCGGIEKALSKIPQNKRFLLIWSDLVLSKDLELPKDELNYVGLSKDFKCRWSFNEKGFVEEPSYENGVAGFFIFQNKDILDEVPSSGEFVKWLGEKNIEFKTFDLYGTKEFGTLEEYNKLEVNKCRPFNKSYLQDDKFIKVPVNAQGEELAVKEKRWYKEVAKINFNRIPKIYSYDPLTMELLKGKNYYQLEELSLEEKKNALNEIIATINRLHSLSSIETDMESVRANYLDKTFDRLEKIQDLVPFAKEEFIVVNGKKCRNVFFYKNELIEKIEKLDVPIFNIIHGDPTFSNMMLNDGKCILIDPRGYFGNTLLYGDASYDWAKIYYSLVGNYDKFNLKKFRLLINDSDVELNIESNGWEELEDYFFEQTHTDKQTIKLIHAIIWLSLTTYAWQDYDSICGAFYNGLVYLEEVL